MEAVSLTKKVGFLANPQVRFDFAKPQLYQTLRASLPIVHPDNFKLQILKQNFEWQILII